MQLCRNTILLAERADMCNRTCSVKRSVTRQGHDARDKEGRSELAGKPIEGLQSSSCRAAQSSFFKTSVWAAGAPFPSLPPLPVHLCSGVLPRPGISRYLSAVWHHPVKPGSVQVLAVDFPAFVLLTVSPVLPALYGQLRLGRSHVASRWQSRVSTAALLRPLPILHTVNSSPFFSG